MKKLIMTLLCLLTISVQLKAQGFEMVKSVDEINFNDEYLIVYKSASILSIMVADTSGNPKINTKNNGNWSSEIMNGNLPEEAIIISFINGTTDGTYAMKYTYKETVYYIGCSSKTSSVKVTNQATLSNKNDVIITFPSKKDSHANIFFTYCSRILSTNGSTSTSYSLKESSTDDLYLYRRVKAPEPVEYAGLSFIDASMPESGAVDNTVYKDGDIYMAGSVTFDDVHGYNFPFDFTADDVSYSRELTEEQATNWQSICLPFAVPASYWNTTKGYKVIKISDIQNDSEYVTFENLESTEEMEAGKPYLIKANGEEISFSLNNVEVIGAPSEEAATRASVPTMTLSGTYVPTTITDTNIYALSGGVFKHSGGQEKILKPFRAYLKVTNSSLNHIKIRTSAETTGIENIDAEPAENIFYDLNGFRVDHPDKGIYIFNGKKVIFN